MPSMSHLALIAIVGNAPKRMGTPRQTIQAQQSTHMCSISGTNGRCTMGLAKLVMLSLEADVGLSLEADAGLGGDGLCMHVCACHRGEEHRVHAAAWRMPMRVGLEYSIKMSLAAIASIA